MENEELPRKTILEEAEQIENIEQEEESVESLVGQDDSLRISEIDIEISKKEQNIEETKNKIDDIRNSLGLSPNNEIPPSIQSEKDGLEKLNKEKLDIEETKIQGVEKAITGAKTEPVVGAMEKHQTPKELKNERLKLIIGELKKETDNLTDEGKYEIFFDYMGKGKNSIPARAEKILLQRFPEYDGLTTEQHKEKSTIELQNTITDSQVRDAETFGGYEEQSPIEKYTDQELLTTEDVPTTHTPRGESEFGVPTKEHKEEVENTEQEEMAPEDFLEITNKEEQKFKQETTDEVNKLNPIDLDQPTFEKIKNEIGIEKDLNALNTEAETVANEEKKPGDQFSSLAFEESNTNNSQESINETIKKLEKLEETKLFETNLRNAIDNISSDSRTMLDALYQRQQQRLTPIQSNDHFQMMASTIKNLKNFESKIDLDSVSELTASVRMLSRMFDEFRVQQTSQMKENTENLEMLSYGARRFSSSVQENIGRLPLEMKDEQMEAKSKELRLAMQILSEQSQKLWMFAAKMRNNFR